MQPMPTSQAPSNRQRYCWLLEWLVRSCSSPFAPLTEATCAHRWQVDQLLKKLMKLNLFDRVAADPGRAFPKEYFGELPALIERRVGEGQSKLDSELVQQQPQTETHKPPTKLFHTQPPTELFQAKPPVSLDA